MTIEFSSTIRNSGDIHAWGWTSTKVNYNWHVPKDVTYIRTKSYNNKLPDRTISKVLITMNEDVSFGIRYANICGDS